MQLDPVTLAHVPSREELTRSWDSIVHQPPPLSLIPRRVLGTRYSVLGSFASNSIPDLHKLNSQNYLVFHPMFGVFGPKAQYYHTLTFWYWYSSLRNTNEIPSVPHCCLRPCRYPNYCILLVILVSSLPANPFLVQFHPFLVHSWSLFHGACRPHVDSIPHIRIIKTSSRVIVFSTTPGFRTKISTLSKKQPYCTGTEGWGNGWHASGRGFEGCWRFRALRPVEERRSGLGTAETRSCQSPMPLNVFLCLLTTDCD